jgi:hypothetical protein
MFGDTNKEVALLVEAIEGAVSHKGIGFGLINLSWCISQAIDSEGVLYTIANSIIYKIDHALTFPYFTELINLLVSMIL